MANIYLTETAQFKPFSYQEMLAPIKDYQDAYDIADEKLNLLLEDAATKAFNFAPQDTVEKAIYDNMMTKLKEASDKLSSGDPTAFKTIREVNKEYRKTMIPIQQKMAKRAELAAEQRTKNVNGNLIFTIDYSTESLDKITSASTYQTINLDDIQKQTALDFGAETGNILRNFEPEAIGKTGYVLQKTGYGYTPEEFEDAFTLDSNGKHKIDNPIYQFYKQEADRIDELKLNDESKDKMKLAVYKGMQSAAGEFQYERFIDYSTKPSSGNKPGGKGGVAAYTVLPHSANAKTVTIVLKSGKTVLADVAEWDENGKAIKFKAESFRNVPNSPQLTDDEMVKIVETFDEEGNLLKTVKTSTQHEDETPQVDSLGTSTPARPTIKGR